MDSNMYRATGVVNGHVIVRHPDGDLSLVDIDLLIVAVRSMWEDWGGSVNATDPEADGYETLQKVRKAILNIESRS